MPNLFYDRCEPTNRCVKLGTSWKLLCIGIVFCGQDRIDREQRKKACFNYRQSHHVRPCSRYRPLFSPLWSDQNRVHGKSPVFGPLFDVSLLNFDVSPDLSLDCVISNNLLFFYQLPKESHKYTYYIVPRVIISLIVSLVSFIFY